MPVNKLAQFCYYCNKKHMTTTYYTLAFDFEGKHYEGRLSPEFKHGHSQPASWHTVLNDVFYGYLHKNEGVWEVY